MITDMITDMITAAKAMTTNRADSSTSTVAADYSTTKGVTRRAVLQHALGVSGAAAAGVALGAAGTVAIRDRAASNEYFGSETISCHGIHQAGIVTPHTAHARALCRVLKPETQKADIWRLLRVLTDDIERLTAGRAPLADFEPELATSPARLTITVGFGLELVQRVAPEKKPAWLQPLEHFSTDKLDPGYTGGDLLLLIAADDQLTVSHAAHMLTRSLRELTLPHWIQDGFRTARGAGNPNTTMRNLMGQVDGTVNPDPQAADFGDIVWLDTDSGWLAGGTCMVFRRIRMELETWDQVGRAGREAAVGRDLATGAPLSGGSEHTPVDFNAQNELGLPIIHAGAHIRRAHSENPRERIYRRALNYDTGSEQGLLFVCYQQDPIRQFSSIQRRLAEFDMLNEWITHTGSAVFAIPAGWQPGEIIGQALF